MTRYEHIRDELAQFADELPSSRQSLASLRAGAEETIYWQEYWRRRRLFAPHLQLVDDFGQIIDHSPLATPIARVRKFEGS